MRARGANKSLARVQNPNSHKQKLLKVSSWLEPILKSKLKDKARAEGLSVSATIAAIVRKHFQTDADLQYSAFLEPIIARAINKNMRERDARIISLLVRIAFDSGQTRSIVTNILGLQPDISPEFLRDIIAESDKRAKANIMRKTPQITELIEALEKWFFETRKEGKESQPH